MEHITDVDYAHIKRVCKDFEICFENFRKTCLKIYDLDPANFFSAPGLAWQAALKKKTKRKLDILTHINMLLMLEKGIRGGICHSIH